jgi:hypothetical protein
MGNRRLLWTAELCLLPWIVVLPLADAWFDVVTARDDVVFSLLMAGLEVPLALVCLSVAAPRPVAHA